MIGVTQGHVQKSWGRKCNDTSPRLQGHGGFRSGVSLRPDEWEGMEGRRGGEIDKLIAFSVEIIALPRSRVWLSRIWFCFSVFFFFFATILFGIGLKKESGKRWVEREPSP